MILPKGHCDHFRMITNQEKPEQSPQSDRIHNICKSFSYDCKHPTKKQPFTAMTMNYEVIIGVIIFG